MRSSMGSRCSTRGGAWLLTPTAHDSPGDRFVHRSLHCSLQIGTSFGTCIRWLSGSVKLRCSSWLGCHQLSAPGPPGASASAGKLAPDLVGSTPCVIGGLIQPPRQPLALAAGPSLFCFSRPGSLRLCTVPEEARLWLLASYAAAALRLQRFSASIFLRTLEGFFSRAALLGSLSGELTAQLPLPWPLVFLGIQGSRPCASMALISCCSLLFCPELRRGHGLVALGRHWHAPSFHPVAIWPQGLTAAWPCVGIAAGSE